MSVGEISSSQYMLDPPTLSHSLEIIWASCFVETLETGGMILLNLLLLR